MRLITALVLALVLLVGAFAPGTAFAEKRKVVELEYVAPKTYRLDGVEYDYAAIQAKLAEMDKDTPIRKLVLVGGSSMGDVIDFALLGKPIGARTFHKVNGELRSITLN